jgi:hypothetical protein
MAGETKMIKFTKIKEPYNQFDTSTIEHTVDSVVAHEVVSEFFYFMMGAGWHRDSVIMAFDACLEEHKPEEENE